MSNVTRPAEEILDDLALAILAILPEQGSKIGKYLADAKSSQTIKKELDDPYVNPQNIGRRLANLREFGLVLPIGKRDARAGHLWQRTPAGKAYSEAQNGHN